MNIKSLKIGQSLILAGKNVGIMQLKDLQTSFPHLASAYKSTYGAKHPDIKIITDTSFTFPSEQYEGGNWHDIYLSRNGTVAHIPASDSKYHGQHTAIAKGDAILDCLRGNFSMCRLYVHPDEVAKLLPDQSETELSKEEKSFLEVFRGTKSFAREEEFYRSTKAPAGTYPKILDALIAKGLIKKNAAGSSQLTLKGKDIASRLSRY
jgi:hypothetical protein